MTVSLTPPLSLIRIFTVSTQAISSIFASIYAEIGSATYHSPSLKSHPFQINPNHCPLAPFSTYVSIWLCLCNYHDIHHTNLNWLAYWNSWWTVSFMKIGVTSQPILFKLTKPIHEPPPCVSGTVDGTKCTTVKGRVSGFRKPTF